MQQSSGIDNSLDNSRGDFILRKIIRKWGSMNRNNRLTLAHMVELGETEFERNWREVDESSAPIVLGDDDGRE